MDYFVVRHFSLNARIEVCSVQVFWQVLTLAGWKRRSNMIRHLFGVSGRSIRSRTAWRTSATGTQSSGSPSTYFERNLWINSFTNKAVEGHQKVYQAHRSSNEDEVSEAMDGRDSNAVANDMRGV